VTTISINQVKYVDDLLKVYPRQTSPQPAYIALDCQTGEMWADWNGEIGNAVPSDVWHGHTRRYGIPVLRGATANALMSTIAPLAQRVLNGYERGWDGNNHRAYFTDDASLAEDEIAAIIAEYEPDLCWVDATDWMPDVATEVKSLLAEGKDIDALIKEYDGDGTTEDCPLVLGLRNWLEQVAEDAQGGLS